VTVRSFGGARIEDLRLPFFCCSVDLNSHSLMVHRAGDVWRYVRASMSLGGYLPPICDKRPGEPRLYCLVDGGYMNNVPCDVMRAQGAAHVIAVNVTGQNVECTYDFGDSLSGFWLLLRWLASILGFIKRDPLDLGTYGGVPSAAQIATTLAFVGSQFKLQEEAQKLADVWIEPDLSTFSILDYHKYKKIADIGYLEAKAAIQIWKARLADSGSPPAWIK